jgi:hypothetical protein
MSIFSLCLNAVAQALHKKSDRASTRSDFISTAALAR